MEISRREFNNLGCSVVFRAIKDYQRGGYYDRVSIRNFITSDLFEYYMSNMSGDPDHYRRKIIDRLDTIDERFPVKTCQVRIEKTGAEAPEL